MHLQKPDNPKSKNMIDPFHFRYRMEPKVKVTERIRELLQDVTEALDTDTTNEIEEIKKYLIKNEKNTEIPFKLVHFAYKNRKPGTHHMISCYEKDKTLFL